MKILRIRTSEREELVEISGRVADAVREAGVTEGLVYLWAMHTTCSLTVNENADPDVGTDMVRKMRELVPLRDAYYRHMEGNSDAHVKTSLFGPGLTLIVHQGRVVMGRWQGVFLAEWDGPRTRSVAVKTVSC
jgi:secondary thiamine-phosphate synthase enzyme